MPATAIVSKVKIEDTLSVEKEVRQYFKDIPLLVRIAECESRFRQIDKKGNVIRGRVNKGDVGVMQINEYYHLEKAKELGLDIYSLKDNMKYARYLYGKSGSQPWISSSPCWNA